MNESIAKRIKDLCEQALTLKDEGNDIETIEVLEQIATLEFTSTKDMAELQNRYDNISEARRLATSLYRELRKEGSPHKQPCYDISEALVRKTIKAGRDLHLDQSSTPSFDFLGN